MDLVNKRCIGGWWWPYVGVLNIGFNLWFVVVNSQITILNEGSEEYQLKEDFQ